MIRVKRDYCISENSRHSWEYKENAVLTKKSGMKASVSLVGIYQCRHCKCEKTGNPQ